MPSIDKHLRAGHQALRMKRPKQALAHFGEALAVDANSTEATEGLAKAFRADGQALNALKALNHLLSTGRATVEAWLAAAELLLDLGECAQALEACQKGLQLEEDDSKLHHCLGMAAYALGEADLAAHHLARADILVPRIQSLASRAILLPGAPSASEQDILETRRALAQRLASDSPLAGRPRPPRPDNPRPRLGYLSAHFHNENYMKPVWALLNHHDRTKFDLHLFSDGKEPSLEFPGFRKSPADHVHHVAKLDSRQLAQRIADEQIDLLVDLSNYSVPDRFDLFLSPPAPIVATWFNAFATSGLPGIDVLIGDNESVNPDEAEFYSERLALLPLSYLTFEVTHPVPPVVDPPCVANGHLTFGSLITQYKITPPVLDAWAEILRSAPTSRLVLSNKTLKSKQNTAWLLQRFAERGVAAERLAILPPAPHLEFLGYYDQIDLALDGFPYNGGTTTMEAIWQGVPVLTFDGDRWASRTSQTILRRTHLAEFSPDTCAEMIALAIRLANDPDTPARLTTLRREMRDRLATSSACDGPALARAMEDLYDGLLQG